MLVSLVESYEVMFQGNIDDCFRVGIAMKKKNTLNLKNTSKECIHPSMITHSSQV